MSTITRPMNDRQEKVAKMLAEAGFVPAMAEREHFDAATSTVVMVPVEDGRMRYVWPGTAWRAILSARAVSIYRHEEKSLAGMASFKVGDVERIERCVKLIAAAAAVSWE